MSPIWNILFTVLLLIIWIVAGGYITQANVFLTSYSNIDSNFNKAYWYSFTVAFLTWVLVLLAIIGMITLIVFSPEIGATSIEISEESFNSGQAPKALRGVSWLTLTILIVSLLLVFTTGIFSALTATNIKWSHNYNPSNGKMTHAYNNSVIATSLSLVTSLILIIGLIVYIIIKNKQKEKARNAMDDETFSNVYQHDEYRDKLNNLSSSNQEFKIPYRLKDISKKYQIPYKVRFDNKIPRNLEYRMPYQVDQFNQQKWRIPQPRRR